MIIQIVESKHLTFFDLEKIEHPSIGKSHLKEFLNGNPNRYHSRLTYCASFTPEKTMSDYETGRIIVLSSSPRMPIMRYDHYQARWIIKKTFFYPSFDFQILNLSLSIRPPARIEPKAPVTTLKRVDIETIPEPDEKCKEILIEKVSGPDEITIGSRIEYTIDSYSVKNVPDKCKEKVKWKVEFYGTCDAQKPIRSIDDCSTVPSVFQIERDKLVIKKVPDFWNCCVGVYPYMKSPTPKVRQLSNLVEYTTLFKGKKEWGQLQGGMTRKHRRLTDQELANGLDFIGKANVAIMKPMSENLIQGFYENGPLGVEAVLSDIDEMENKVINNFYNGNGKKLSFDENTQQSKQLKELESFQEYWEKYLCVIISLAKKGDFSESDIINGFGSKSKSRPNFSNISEIPSYDYYGFMGGTQKIVAEIEVKHYTSRECQKGNHYIVKTKMFIQDWYGADWGDINGWESKLKGNVYSLNAFFWLQHHYGYQPFETEIIYKSEDIISEEELCE